MTRWVSTFMIDSPRGLAAGWRPGRVQVSPGLELAYEQLGEGRPLVLIMGLGAQRVLWDDRFCARLAERGFRVVRFDHRDIGDSTRLDHLPVPRPWPVLARRMAGLPIDAPYDLSDMARDVVALCDHLGLDRAHFVGASMGGMIAQHLAIEHPRRVASLTSIMSTPGARRWSLATRPAALRALLLPRPRSAEQAADHIVHVFRVIGGSRYPVDEEHLRALGHLLYERGFSPRGFLRHLAAICASGDRTRALAAVRVPTAVIHGSDDPLVPVLAGRATARAIQGARLMVIPGMGHHLPSGVWDMVIDLVTATTARS
jgi:pimeloyl-ACP methyl ester carboxylesterase